jgi:hypothetical protein
MFSRCRPVKLESEGVLSPIYRRQDSPASKLSCKVGNVPNGILVGDGPSVQSTIVATDSPAVFFLGDKVEERRPEAVGAPSSAVSEHLELGFRNSVAVRC